MKLLSLNAGTPKEIQWQGKNITTSIFKNPVSGKRKVSFSNLEGDEQSNKKVHGGINKAVYSYSIEYYDYWKQIINRDDWESGLFGENLTTEGLLDEETLVGNVYKIGTAKIMAVQPRFPCNNLCAKFELTEMINMFYNSKRHGIYFKVIEEGYLEKGDKITLVDKSKYNITIKDITESKITKGKDKEKLKQILELTILPDNFRESFRQYEV